MHAGGSGSVRVCLGDEATFVPFIVISDPDGLWVIRLAYGEPLMINVYGAQLPVVYNDEFLAFVQIEFPEIEQEDPPPSAFWLPHQLRLDLVDARDIAARLLANEIVEFTAMVAEPTYDLWNADS